MPHSKRRKNLNGSEESQDYGRSEIMLKLEKLEERIEVVSNQNTQKLILYELEHIRGNVHELQVEQEKLKSDIKSLKEERSVLVDELEGIRRLVTVTRREVEFVRKRGKQRQTRVGFKLKEIDTNDDMVCETNEDEGCGPQPHKGQGSALFVAQKPGDTENSDELKWKSVKNMENELLSDKEASEKFNDVSIPSSDELDSDFDYGYRETEKTLKNDSLNNTRARCGWPLRKSFRGISFKEGDFLYNSDDDQEFFSVKDEDEELSPVEQELNVSAGDGQEILAHATDCVVREDREVGPILEGLSVNKCQDVDGNCIPRKRQGKTKKRRQVVDNPRKRFICPIIGCSSEVVNLQRHMAQLHKHLDKQEALQLIHQGKKPPKRIYEKKTCSICQWNGCRLERHLKNAH